MYLLDVSIRCLKYFCVLFVLFVYAVSFIAMLHLHLWWFYLWYIWSWGESSNNPHFQSNYKTPNCRIFNIVLFFAKSRRYKISLTASKGVRSPSRVCDEQRELFGNSGLIVSFSKITSTNQIQPGQFRWFLREHRLTSWRMSFGGFIFTGTNKYQPYLISIFIGSNKFQRI